LDVDAREAPRKIFHARMMLPVSPGPLTLLYPKWIPGEHSPTGPIVDLAGLRIMAGQKTIAWRRDTADMYAFHCEIPADVKEIQVELDYLSPIGKEGFTSAATASDQLAAISWQHLLLYPKGAAGDEIEYAVSLRLPPEWKFGTSLRVAAEISDRIEFKPVSLTLLIDSPLITGRHFRTIRLNAEDRTPVWMHIVGDSEEAIQIKDEFLAGYRKLVAETLALFGARHYDEYHFLVTLSDHVAHFGLEHHESSDNRVPENAFTDAAVHRMHAGLLAHEFVHSWNAKYRRPAGLTTPDPHQPMHGDLLWVYEGLTSYLGRVLAARSGLWTQQDYRDKLALTVAEMQRPGRTWRSLVDTAVAAQILYEASDAWIAWRRKVDFYGEGELIWLEADVTIRKITVGKKSLDDFCRLFYGGSNTGPRVRTYTFEDLIAALNQVAPNDWRNFFETRIYSVAPQTPLGGIEQGGWKISYTAERTRFQIDREEEQEVKSIDVSSSIGLWIKEDGNIIDVLPGSPSAKAGIGPGMKLVAVNGRRYAPKNLRTAIAATKAGKHLELLVENTEYFETHQLDYQDGERYPQLERDPSKPDVLQQIIAPLAK
jgi:predicted metalloprotease with PDZ domain